MEVETLLLVTIVRHVQHSNQPNVILVLEELLDESPEASNYLVNTTTTLVGFESSLCRILQTFRSSTIPLRRHLEIDGLAAECKVRLYSNQVQRFAWLIIQRKQE